MREFLEIERNVREYHASLLSQHGDSAEGVGWKDAASQELRFRMLGGVFQSRRGFSVLDAGCGVGAFLAFLIREGYTDFHYTGIDVSPDSVALAKKKFSSHVGAVFEEATLDKIDGTFDYVVSSGIFNLRVDQDDDTWLRYIKKMIEAQFRAARIATAFNCLTCYRDFSAPELYYSDPGALFHFCKSNLSRFVALRHDYPLWEFTVYVYREARATGGATA